MRRLLKNNGDSVNTWGSFCAKFQFTAQCAEPMRTGISCIVTRCFLPGNVPAAVKFRFVGQCAEPMRARLVCIRYRPIPALRLAYRYLL